MSISINIETLNIEEKLQLMEMLWEDLSKNCEDILSPPWHNDILKHRENKLRQGTEDLLDWKQSKHNIINTITNAD